MRPKRGTTGLAAFRIMRATGLRPVARFIATAWLAAFLTFAAGGAAANSDPLTDVLSVPGGAGLGLVSRFENSLYREGGTRHDFLPLYLYEGKYLYLHTYRLGLKFGEEKRRFDVFLSHRFEGFPYDRVPTSLAGMAARQPGLDIGASYRIGGEWGSLYAEALHDVLGGSKGNELRVGYGYEWQSGRVRLRPQLSASLRDGKLNDYYYGVRPDEATALRPAYDPGAGLNAQFALYGSYRLSDRWRLLGGVSATRWASGVRHSPIVQDRTQYAGMLGVAYDFSPDQEHWPEGRPLIVKLMYGKATDCNLIAIMRLTCTSTDTIDRTRINAIELGRPLIERANGWPLDFVGYVGLLRHDERGLQADSWQVNAYVKGYFYGLPWSHRVRTRIGMGIGISYAQRVPFVEERDQIRRGRSSSKLLNYLDPSIDFSLGDLIGVRSLRDTYVGVGTSHRSGIFGSSQLLGNVNGGSNYIYTYVEWQ
jgi:outer membrane protein